MVKRIKIKGYSRFGLYFAMIFFTLSLALNRSIAHAQNLEVVATIEPIHAWVSAVMRGVGEPVLLIKGGKSVHNYRLKPSDARLLARADIVFMVDKHLETYLQRPLLTLAAQAQRIALTKAPGVHLLQARRGGNFEEHHHHHHYDGDDFSHYDSRHAYIPHDVTGSHNLESRPQDRADLHFWLDPENAIAATKYIAAVLSKADPEHEEEYYANARGYIGQLKHIISDLHSKLEDAAWLNFIVFHDAYHYFESRFHLHAVGSITVDPDVQPSAKRVKEIKDKISKLGAVCVFSEPQFEPALVDMLIKETKAVRGVLDPLGADLTPGPDSYKELLYNIADAILACANKLPH